MQTNWYGKVIWSGVLGVSLMAGAAMPAFAYRDRDDDCQKNVAKAERNLDKAVRKHGERSRQAEQQRRKLEEVRERCHGGDRDHDRH